MEVCNCHPLLTTAGLKCVRVAGIQTFRVGSGHVERIAFDVFSATVVQNQRVCDLLTMPMAHAESMDSANPYTLYAREGQILMTVTHFRPSELAPGTLLLNVAIVFSWLRRGVQLKLQLFGK